VQKLREAWWAVLKGIDPEHLVFLDESGATTAMTRRYGRAEPGVRVEGAVPDSHWTVTTMIGAVRLEGVAALGSIEQAMDGPSFLAFVREALVPTLREGDVVVMDNLGAHKVPGVKEAIEAARARVAYLPPYSPDYNPIENFWSKLKQFLRDAAARTTEALGQAIQHAAQAVTAADLRGWFSHCGYSLATPSP
jgi:transposase